MPEITSRLSAALARSPIKRAALIAALALGVLAPAAVASGPPQARSPCGAPIADSAGAVVDRYLTDQVERGFSGAVAVEVRGKLVLCKGYGWTDSTRAFPISPDTRFFIASVAKQITAAAVLLLSEDGRLRLEDSIVRFFPGLAGTPAAAITIQQLLTHRAGLGGNYRADGTFTRSGAIEAVFRDSLATVPGTVFHYTNDAYAVLAAVIEVVSDQSYESFVSRRLLLPLGLKKTGFWGFVDELDASRYAQTEEPLDSAMRPPNWGRRGSEGIWSTAGDLYRWYRAVWRSDVLSPDSRGSMFTPSLRLESGTGIGFGTYESATPSGGIERWTRGTEDFGHNAVIRWFPDEDLAVIVLSNSGEIEGTYANQLISDGIVELLRSGRADGRTGG